MTAQAGDGAMVAVHELKSMLMEVAARMTRLHQGHKIRIEFAMGTDAGGLTTLATFRAPQELKLEQ